MRPVLLAAWLAAAVAFQPDPEALASLFRQALAEREKQFGGNHPRVARAASDLGLFLRNQGRRSEAEPLLRRAAEIDERELGAASLLFGEDLENLASVLDPVDGVPVYRRAAQHPNAGVAARALTRLASLEEARGNRPAALELYRTALAKDETAQRLNDAALLEDPKAAEPLLRRALAIQEKALGPRHPETAVTANNLANVLLATGRAAQAEPLARGALRSLEDALGPRHPRVATAWSNLGDILRARKDLSGARRAYERALQVDEAAHGPNHPEVAVDLDNLAGFLEEIGRAAEARNLRKRAATIKAGR